MFPCYFLKKGLEFTKNWPVMIHFTLEEAVCSKDSWTPEAGSDLYTQIISLTRLLIFGFFIIIQKHRDFCFILFYVL